MGYKVDGYFFISVDVMVKFRDIEKLPIDRPWYVKLDPLDEMNINIGAGLINTHRGDDYLPWQKRRERNALSRSLREMEDLNLTKAIRSQIYYSYFKRVSSNSQLPDHVCQGMCITYQPRYQRCFCQISSIYLKNSVYLEFAVPSLILALGLHACPLKTLIWSQCRSAHALSNRRCVWAVIGCFCSVVNWFMITLLHQMPRSRGDCGGLSLHFFYHFFNCTTFRNLSRLQTWHTMKD